MLGSSLPAQEPWPMSILTSRVTHSRWPQWVQILFKVFGVEIFAQDLSFLLRSNLMWMCFIIDNRGWKKKTSPMSSTKWRKGIRDLRFWGSLLRTRSKDYLRALPTSRNERFASHHLSSVASNSWLHHKNDCLQGLHQPQVRLCVPTRCSDGKFFSLPLCKTLICHPDFMSHRSV